MKNKHEEEKGKHLFWQEVPWLLWKRNLRQMMEFLENRGQREASTDMLLGLNGKVKSLYENEAVHSCAAFSAPWTST